MVGTIGFAGSKARSQGRTWRWLRRLGLSHLGAAMFSGAIVGFVAAVTGVGLVSLIGRNVVRAEGILLVILALVEVTGLPIIQLSRARQVPMSWKHVFPAPMSAALYGGMLGAGVLTAIYYWSFPALLVGVLAAASPVFGIVAGASFGAGRALPVFLGLMTSDENTLDRTADRLRELLDGQPWIPRMTGAVAISLAAWTSLSLSIG